MWRLVHSEALAHLKTLPANAVDALVTDPPAGIGFMNKEWDDFRRQRNEADAGRDNVFGRASAKGPEYARRSRVAFIDFLTPIFAECLRIMKPGAHGLVWAIPRTSHWTGMALEDSGFEIRDRVSSFFGQGFPKAANAGRQIDMLRCELPGRHYDKTLPAGEKAKPGDHLCLPHTDGDPHRGEFTALKPACEDWWLVRRPLEGTVAQNVLKWGVGALAIDLCRIATTENLNGGAYAKDATARVDGQAWGADRDNPETSFKRGGGGAYVQPAGRWPSHVVLSHTEECELVGTRKITSGVAGGASRGFQSEYVGGEQVWTQGKDATFNGADGKEEIDDWRCAEDCPVRLLDEQSGMGVSRFFYCAKVSKKERGGSKHPTMKPIALMRWLCRLVTPPKGAILDPFCGSGSTILAALLEGFSAYGIEREEEYVQIAVKRIRALETPPRTEATP